MRTWCSTTSSSTRRCRPASRAHARPGRRCAEDCCQLGAGDRRLRRPPDRGRDARRSKYRLERRATPEPTSSRGCCRAIDMLDAVIAPSAASEDGRPPGAGCSWRSPSSSARMQANHILDMTLGRLTRLGRSELARRRWPSCERRSLSSRRSSASRRDAARVSSRLSWIALRDKYANERRTKSTARPGRAQHRGPDRGRGDRRRSHAGRVHQDGAGRTPSDPGARAGEASRAAAAEGRRPTSTRSSRPAPTRTY